MARARSCRTWPQVPTGVGLAPFVFLLERSAESLDLILSVLLVKGAGESRALVPLDVLALHVILRMLDGVAGVF